MRVDLPDPDGPTKNTKSPRAIENVACSTPMSPESYSLATPRNSMTGLSAGAGRAGIGPTGAGLGGGAGGAAFLRRNPNGGDEMRRGGGRGGQGGRFCGGRRPGRQ